MPRLACALLLGAGLAVFTPALADDDDDHEFARRALEAGEVSPLSELLPKVSDAVPGDILEIELDREGARYVYELKILAPEGVVKEVEMDAKSGEIIDIGRDDDDDD